MSFMIGEILAENFDKDSAQCCLNYRGGGLLVKKYFESLTVALEASLKLVKRGCRFHIDNLSKDYYAHSVIYYLGGKNRQGRYKCLGGFKHIK